MPKPPRPARRDWITPAAKKTLSKHRLGFWQVRHKPSPTDLEKYYATKYYQQATGSYEHTYTPDELAYFEHQLRAIRSLLEPGRPARTPRRLLDVGCGEGFALAHFRAAGWKVSGYDFSSGGLERQNPACREHLEVGDVFQLLRRDIRNGERYHAVMLRNVLEHVLAPLDLLRDIRRLVAPGGRLVVTVPNDFSPVQRAAFEAGHIDRNFWVAVPDHQSYFNAASLCATMEHTGWNCVDLFADFPVDWFLFHPGANYIRESSAGKPAHQAKIQISNLINRSSPADALALWRAMAATGCGRNLTMIARPAVQLKYPAAKGTT